MMRVQKYLSEQGILSRRKAEEYIRAGKIMVNGKKAVIGQSIDPANDKVEVAGASPSFEAMLLYKPRGIVSSRSSKEGKTVFDLFPQWKHLHIAGRLDKESEGLLLLTNDGILAKKLTGEDHLVEKEYKVTVRETVRPNHLLQMESGIKLEDGMTLPAKGKRLGGREFSLTLREGRNHQIRRMCDVLRLTVTRLVRTRIGPIGAKGMKEGASRPLTKEEIGALKKLSL
ncbi:rRNA pseudouridine synthase [Candidatus Parcubacteria bacterium]|nr:rRNA pseudouridine synthase [Candidatus Parcubacteria bacterium]